MRYFGEPYPTRQIGMFVEENSASIYLQGMPDRSMRSGTKFVQEIQKTDWSTAGKLSNRSFGVQIPRDICTRFGRYLYSTRCSWIINILIDHSPTGAFEGKGNQSMKQLMHIKFPTS